MRHVFWRKWLRRTFGLARTAPIRRTAPPRLEGLEARWAPAITGTTPTTISPTEGTLFNDSVGTFTTDTPGDTFTATINWGDGTTDAGTVAFTGSTGTVTGSHTYADEFNNLPVNVTVVESGASPDTATINSTANVAEADSLSGTASTITATEGLPFSGQVATFTDSNPSAPASDFTATINWGDGTSSAGTVSGDTGGPFTVNGTHTYAEDGTYSPVVTLSDDTPGAASASATGTATVAEGNFALTGVSRLTLTEGQSFTGTVATFSDPGSPDPASAFSATIDWGDGATSAGTIVSDATPLALTGFTQDVVFEAGTPTPTVSHTFDNTAFAWFQAGATDTSSVTHDDGLPTSFTSQLGTRFQFQSFTADNALLLGPAGGLPSSGTLTLATPASYGTLAILAAASNPASDTATVTVHYTDGTTDTFSYNTPDWGNSGAPGAALPSPVGRALVGPGNTFVGTDPNSGDQWQVFETDIHPDPSKQVASLEFTAPGPNSTGIFAVSGGSAGGFTVLGSHTYADEFSGKINVTVSEGDFTIGPNPDQVTVVEADVLTRFPAQPTPSPTEGVSFSGTVANFRHVGVVNTPADFTATIDWGDGTTTTGVVSNPSGTIYAVDGTHTYADEGSFPVTVTLSDNAPGTASATVTNTITVAEADTLAPVSSQPSATLTEGNATSAAVAVFSDSGYPTNSPSDFSATIDWGDGTSSAGTVSGSGGNFTVSGSHTYADEGSFTATVVLSDDSPGTASSTATSSVTVLEADTLSATATPVFTTEGNPFTDAVVATFSDTNTANTAGDFTAVILWGDNTSSAGTVSGSAGSFTVKGSHTYFDEGVFTPTVFVRDDSPGSAGATAVGTATVAEADSLSGTATSFSTTEGRRFSGQVATFTDSTFPSNPASDFTATIDWGDGTSSAGTVVGAGGGKFNVSGSHTYADEGTFTVTVTLADDVPGSTSATAGATATVSEGDALSGTLAAVSPTEGTSFSGAVATFTNAYSGNPASDFTATINWGDGTTTAGTVSGGSGANLTVSGSHTYADEGGYAARVVLTDDSPGTATGTASGTLSVAEADTLSGTATPIQTTEGTAVSGAVATFTDSTYPNNPATDFTATIDWGDGTTTAGTVSGSGGNFTVSGSHTYTASGLFDVAVTLADDAPGTASDTATTTASVSGDVVVQGTGADDTLVLTRTPGGGPGSITYVLDGGPSVMLTGVRSFTFDALGGNDTMVVDAVNGPPLVPAGVFYDGGKGSNTLRIESAGLVVRAVPGALTIADTTMPIADSVTVHHTNAQALNVNSASAVNAFAGPDTADRATAFAGLSPEERFVQAVYLDELGRPGTKAELDGWASLFASPGTTPSQAQAAIASGVQHSAEGRDHLVKSWYVAFLGRQATGGEEQGWVNQLLAGQTEEQVLSQILGSSEFYARAQTLVPSGTPDERYVQALYQLLLDRTGSPAEVAGWVKALPSVGRQGVALGILSSREFRTYDFEGYYDALLHRPADQPSLANWVGSTLDVGAVRVDIEASTEFLLNG